MLQHGGASERRDVGVVIGRRDLDHVGADDGRQRDAGVTTSRAWPSI
jgi:hypothetical protein